MSKVYKITMLMDKDWKDQLYTWLEFADEIEDEVCQVISVEEVNVDAK